MTVLLYTCVCNCRVSMSLVFVCKVALNISCQASWALFTIGLKKKKSNHCMIDGEGFTAIAEPGSVREGPSITQTYRASLNSRLCKWKPCSERGNTESQKEAPRSLAIGQHSVSAAVSAGYR